MDGNFMEMQGLDIGSEVQSFRERSCKLMLHINDL
jgi:hypothetical protein